MPNTTYRIAKVERWTDLDAFKNPVKGYRVAFEMSTGAVDWVFISEKLYSKAAVNDLIKAKVALHDDLLA